MKERCEFYIQSNRFNINKVYNDVFIGNLVIIEPFQSLMADLIRLVGQNDCKKIIRSLLRFSFFIEPVKQSDIKTTKFDVRWSPELEQDPRFTSYADCYAIFEASFRSLIQELQEKRNVLLIKMMVNKPNVSYELPIDYISRTATPIHIVNNVSWCFGGLPLSVVKLRQFLTDSSKHDYATFFTGIYNKIKTKTYLTDRVLTGLYKTNREKRWECHPSSVQFALRKVAWAIELKLIKQVCHFAGFPHNLRDLLTRENILIFENQEVLCPITLEPLSFDLLKREIENTTHGKSDFQVGHMNPLKAETQNEIEGHTPENISWISEQGNRIQGSNSVDFIREFVIKVYHNYRSVGYPGAD